MNIVIASARQARGMMANKPGFYRVISIGTNNLPRPKAKENLCLNFNDVTQNSLSTSGLATIPDCEKALEFLSQGGNCIVHCQLGVSRSPAVTLGYLLQHYPYKKAVNCLFNIRPPSSPNLYVVKLMCQILGLLQEYSDIVDCIKNTELPLAKVCNKCSGYACKKRNVCLYCDNEEFELISDE